MINDLNAQERAEFEAAVTAAYRDEEGEVRSHREALREFRESILPDAVQAHRRWAHIVMDAATELGLRTILQKRWKSSGGIFHAKVHGKHRTRPMRRGVRRINPETGEKYETQLELLLDSADDLKNKIAEAARRINEEAATIAMLRKLLDLLEATGAGTVERGLVAVGMTLDEYLSQDEQATA